jgi:hypothetical protein
MPGQLRTGTMQRGLRPGARLRGIAVLVALGATLIAVTAMISSGRADAAVGPDSQYYRSSPVGITPEAPGVEFMVHDNAGSVMLTNATGTKTVIVTGYSGEDYLKITPTSVYENSNSLTAALNKTDGKSAPPARLTTGKKLPVKWVRTGAVTNSVMWKDFRVRWNSQQRPPIVADDPQSPHEVFAWAVPIKVDGRSSIVRGSVNWTGAPAPAETKHYSVAIGLGVAFLIVLLLMISASARRRRGERNRARPEPEYSTSRFIASRN